MTKRINDVFSTLKRVNEDRSSLVMLLEFEKTLDNASLYAYRNWMNGELVEGPEMNRYWFTTTWMYPRKMMPDPQGGLRLVKYGCKVYYKKDTLFQPTRVFGPEDIVDDETQRKKAKLEELPVWLVTIEMPRKFVDEAQEGTLQIGDIEVDVEDIQAAYDENLEDAGTREVDVGAEADTREAEFGDEFGAEEEV